MQFSWKVFFLFSMGLGLATTASATWAPHDDEVPIERLLANLQQQLAANPDSKELISQIARVHSRAYAMNESKVLVTQTNKGPEGTVTDDMDKLLDLYEHESVSYQSPEDSLEVMSEARLTHLLAAIEFYGKAVGHPEANPTDWLGQGYTSREAARHVRRLLELEGKSADESGVEKRRQEFLEQSLQAYEKVFSKYLVRRVHGRDPAALEAGNAIVAILSERKGLDANMQRHLKVIRRKVAEFQVYDDVTPQMITPIIFHLTQSRLVQELLSPEVQVKFDLDGSGVVKTWPWVHPDTAFLVWDGNGLGDVPSGRCLIGSVTWWLFWSTGYDVLKALDDNQDGWLEGDELKGLAVWHDRNSNGVSDVGEVQPLATMGVTGLATNASTEAEGMPSNPRGLRVSDGRLLPTYDWIASPVPGAGP